MKSYVIFILTLLLLLFTSCSNGNDGENNPAVIGTPPTLTEPIGADESILLGQVVSVSGSSPIPLSNTEVRLAAVYWNEDKSDGAFTIDESSSPITFTDQSGGFIFRDIASRDYVIVIGDLYSQNVILAHPDGKAVIYSPKDGKVLDVGVLEVDLAAAPIFSATPDEIYPAQIVTPTLDPEKYP
ncbi:MAG: carboxypeptidase-like regulatory domain-containing protein [Anaerolineae bacterium]|nr:MAG: carboxypeptidase-like regulatory domain-containing protein [Anaerolineae bacterium]